MTKDIDISRGVRQGDPLSALLYVLIAEVLGNQIRSNENIKGITIRDIEQKILQYADDTQIFVTNDSSVKETFKELEKYEKATSAKINIEKTEELFIGKWRNRHDKLFDCKWTNNKVMALGLRVGNTDTSELTFREQMSKVRNKLQFWRASFVSHRYGTCGKCLCPLQAMVQNSNFLNSSNNSQGTRKRHFRFCLGKQKA